MYKATRTIYNFNHIDANLSEREISELKALYQYYHKKYWLFKQTYKYFKKLVLACNIGSVALVVSRTIAGGVTLSPIVLGTISGSGLILKTVSVFKRSICEQNLGKNT